MSCFLPDTNVYICYCLQYLCIIESKKLARISQEYTVYVHDATVKATVTE